MQFLAHAYCGHGRPSQLLLSSCNNNNDSVYGAVTMTIAIARVHPVHSMNADSMPGGCQPSDQAN